MSIPYVFIITPQSLLSYEGNMIHGVGVPFAKAQFYAYNIFPSLLALLSISSLRHAP